MDTLTVSQEDSTAGNVSVKSDDDNSSIAGSGRSSPPPKCAICLGTCKNKSFTDSCLHQFCFVCLLTWSKVKAECPLCKQHIKSIIHNVRSNHQYEEYLVEQRQTEEVMDRIDIDNVGNAPPRFRYRTTLTFPRREGMAIQHLLMQYPLLDAIPSTPPRRRRPADFRRTVYRHNLWARPLPDFTGRFRDCNPNFYRFNNAQMHRLIPWLNRELSYLLNENVGHISYVMCRIMELLTQYHINSSEFRDSIRRYFGERTEHFLHELYCFASTPFDMAGYDRNVHYTTDPRVSTMINEVFSSESDGSVDSDIIMLPNTTVLPQREAGPERFEQLQDRLQPPSVNNVIPIETISHSDTDGDDNDVMVVGYIKPPQDRTPEVVDLLGSDSDVVIQDPQPGPSTANSEGILPLVKLILKRHRSNEENDGSDSDSSYEPRGRKRRRNDSATTVDTHRNTPCSSVSWSPVSPESSIPTDYSNMSSNESHVLTRHQKKLKVKKKSRSKSKSRQKQSKSKSKSQDKSKKGKCKSRTGKGIKTTNKKSKLKAALNKESTGRSNASRETTTSSSAHSNRSPCEILHRKSSNDTTSSKETRSASRDKERKRETETDPNYDEPSTSGVSRHRESTSSSDSNKKTLKSVVSIISKISPQHSNTNSLKLTIKTTHEPLDEAEEYDNFSADSESDSEDNLPLNLTTNAVNKRQK